MEYVCSQRQMQEIDRITIEEVGISSEVLMERAAYSVLQEIKDKCSSASEVLVLAGHGNNGGDGVALTRMLLEADYAVTLCVIGNGNSSEGFQKQMDILMQEQPYEEGLTLVEVREERDFSDISKQTFDVIVDSIFGIGLTRELKSPYREIIDMANAMSGLKLALDIPSGLHSLNGAVLGIAFIADVTVTFGFLKQGMLLGEGPKYCGDVKVKQVGFSKKAIASVNPQTYTMAEEDLKNLPKRYVLSNKGSYGKVVVFAGAKDMAGAAYFACGAAYRMGAGLVKLYSHPDNIPVVSTKLPELLTAPVPDDVTKEDIKNIVAEANAFGSVIVIGPGLGKSDGAKMLVETVLTEATVPVVIDADGLNVLSEHMEWLDQKQTSVIITPHVKEMERLCGKTVAEIKTNTLEIAQAFAKQHEVICVLKDARSVVTDGTDSVYINEVGNNGMSTGGTGDVLAGIIGALVASGMAPKWAADYGVLLHGTAGNRARDILGERAMLASDLLEQLPEVTRTLA